MALPDTRKEHYLDAIANLEDGPGYDKNTRSRIENYLDYICNNLGRRKTMPTAGSKYRGKIVQYVGESDGTYTKGYFYVCNEEGSGTYNWSQIDVQPEFNGLSLDNTTAYTPTGDYNPATKKYVDDAVGNIDTLLANLISGGGAE